MVLLVWSTLWGPRPQKSPFLSKIFLSISWWRLLWLLSGFAEMSETWFSAHSKELKKCNRMSRYRLKSVKPFKSYRKFNSFIKFCTQKQQRISKHRKLPKILTKNKILINFWHYYIFIQSYKTNFGSFSSVFKKSMSHMCGLIYLIWDISSRSLSLTRLNTNFMLISRATVVLLSIRI